jgi:DnaJ-class molecular chaperone
VPLCLLFCFCALTVDEDEGASDLNTNFSIPAGPVSDPLSIKRPHFQRLKTGVDLVMEVSVSLQEALLGFRLAFRHLDDRVIVVESPAGHVLENDSILTVANEGMPLEHAPTQHGDLIIKVSKRNTFSPSERRRRVELTTLNSASNHYLSLWIACVC